MYVYIYIYIHTLTEREVDSHRERLTGESDREKDRERERERERERLTERKRERERERERLTERKRETERLTDRELDSERERERGMCGQRPLCDPQFCQKSHFPQLYSKNGQKMIWGGVKFVLLSGEISTSPPPKKKKKPYKNRGFDLFFGVKNKTGQMAPFVYVFLRQTFYNCDQRGSRGG